MPNEPPQKSTSGVEQRVVRIETKLDGLIETVSDFARSTNSRFALVETQQRESGRFSWTAFGTVLVGVGMICTACAAYVNMQVAPLDGTLKMAEAERSGIRIDIQRIEADRHRDQLELDDRLQREMRLVSDIVRASGDTTKEILLRDEKRIDDVTYRFDKMRDDERQELMMFRMRGSAK